MQTFFCICYRIGYNVRRYVALVRQLADGGACFCTRGAMQDYDGYYLILAMAKTVIRQLAEAPGGSRGSLHRRPLSDPL